MRRPLLALLPALVAGCASTPETVAPSPEEAVAAAPAEPSKDQAKVAARWLREGDEALRGNNYEAAARAYEYVRVTFPYLGAATEAELRLADVDYQSDEWLAARDRYNNFVKLHPTSPEVDYAAFRSAMTWYREIPGDFFVLPPSTEKDQTAVRGAQSALKRFLQTHPKSKHVPEAQQALADTERRLAEYEVYVADFYRKSGRWEAVAGRLESVVERFPDSQFAPAALLNLHEAYTKLGRADEARAALQKLVAAYPESPEGKKAQSLLAAAKKG